MNQKNARVLILLAMIGLGAVFLAGPLGDWMGGLHRETSKTETEVKLPKEKIPLPVLKLRKDMVKPLPTEPTIEPKLPAPKSAPSSGTLTNQEIEDVIENRQPLFQRCWTQRLHESPGLTGRALLQFEITPRGKVQDIQVVETTINDEVMLRCLTSVLERISFREFSGGNVTLTFPLAFE